MTIAAPKKTLPDDLADAPEPIKQAWRTWDQEISLASRFSFKAVGRDKRERDAHLSRAAAAQEKLDAYRKHGPAAEIVAAAIKSDPTTLVVRTPAEERAAVLAEADKARKQLGMKPRSYYGRGSEHSYFLDLLRASTPGASARLQHSQESMRAERLQAEQRAISTGTLGAIVPGAAGLPLWTDEAFAMAVRNTAPLLEALLKIPLPDQGVTVPFGKATAGATAVDQSSENSAVTESTDLAVSYQDEPLGMVSAIVTYSWQTIDRGGSVVDELLTRDIAAAWAAKVEADLFAGSGSSGQIRGLANASPSTTGTVPAQTGPAIITKMHGGYAGAASALGAPPDLIAMSTSRAAMLRSQLVNQATGIPLADAIPPGTLVESPAAPTNLGAGTNEDWIWLINRLSTPLAIQLPAIQLEPGGSASSMTGKLTCLGYAAFATARRPEGIAVVKGCTTPVF